MSRKDITNTIFIDIANITERYHAAETIRKNTDKSICFDLSRIGFVNPEDLVHIMCLFKLAKEASQVENHYINQPKKADYHDYCGRMKLYSLVENYIYPGTVKKNPGLVELEIITNDWDTEEKTYKILEVMQNSGLSIAGIGDDIHCAITEIANNIYFHSGQDKNTGWGYMAGQFYPRIRTLEFAFADIGIGFKESYKCKSAFSHMTASEIIEKSFEEMVTSTNDPVRGRGLHIVDDFLSTYDAEIVVRSHEGFVKRKKGATIINRNYDEENKLFGTLVNFRIVL